MKNSKIWSFIISIFNYLLVFNVFAGGFRLFKSTFEFNVGYIFVTVFLLVYVIRYRSVNINPAFMTLLTILTISSFVNVYLGNNTICYAVKQILGIFIMGSAYYLLFKINNFEFDRLFRIYLQIAVVVAIIGIFQEFSFLIGFKNGYDYSNLIPKWILARTTAGMLRVNSIFVEPSHFAITMAPALFVALSNILKNTGSCLKTKLGSMAIIVSYVLTFSAVAYVGMLISLWLIFRGHKKNLKHILLVLTLVPILMYVSYRYESEIHRRVDAVMELVTGSKKAIDVHHSVYMLVGHAFVACKSFMISPMFGHGLGSHPVSYDRFIRSGESYGFWREGIAVTNREDASSLFVRLVSETGLVGTVAVLFFIFRFRVKKNGNEKLYTISNAVFVLFMMQLLKQGHYFYNGLFFFVWLYYLCGKDHGNSEGELQSC